MLYWQKIHEDLAYDGWRKIWQKFFLLPNGKKSRYDVIGNSPYISLAAFTADREAILIRQYRPGPEIILTSCCEGYLDKGEKPEEAARRELLEETGYEAGEIVLLKAKRSAYSTEYQYFLVATDCHWQQEQQLDENEFIDVFTLPLASFRSFINDPEDHSFANIDVAYLALDHLGWL